MSNYIIDISYHNGKVDLSKAKESISGVVARCSPELQAETGNKKIN